ncbi:ArsR/SmtB family transcription factor [Thermococcus thioreducens]|uniref:Helix-turn-helix domain-containing protein n=1 Tax=Thermococcus thioreducens TaxID=277988 RepID=A0A0Q2MRA8_9EURY|nr:helix-turn-helix domain-containing protein [Thermococcus thioreducens]ASJ12769.1 transcriptional regulator [Thermococcus thioreducens]KQH82239.1 transcriptional regulator [Thermococcus thioreducens]SEV85535.1 Helix-turn-helix domain-containing protein [Thermococcus thioreducens]
MDYETIDIHDERAKELAQILINEKAIAILHLLEDRALSMSEISRELELPISTVSYHVDKMLKVGLIEVAGKKYGKRLQEVKLYRASNRPILLVPRKSVAKVKKKAILGFERLHVISLSIAGLISAGVYAISKDLLAPMVRSGANTTYEAGNMTVMSTPEKSIVPMAVNTSTSAIPQATTSPIHAVESAGSNVPIILAVAAFVLTFLLASHFLRRRL